MVLPGSASALRQANSGSGQLRASAHGIPLQALDDCFAQLARTFELAFGETKVQHCVIVHISVHHVPVTFNDQSCIESVIQVQASCAGCMIHWVRQTWEGPVLAVVSALALQLHGRHAWSVHVR